MTTGLALAPSDPLTAAFAHTSAASTRFLVLRLDVVALGAFTTDVVDTRVLLAVECVDHDHCYTLTVLSDMSGDSTRIGSGTHVG